MKDEAAIEAEIQAKGLNAPRLTPALIDATIVGEVYWVPDGTTLTVCVLTLRNGFTVVGKSAAASPSNFDAEIGKKIAREDARNQIWALEGYALREKLANGDPVVDFGMWLTTRDETIKVGASETVYAMNDAIAEYRAIKNSRG